MGLRHFSQQALLSSILVGTAVVGRAQAPAPDSARRPAPLLLKAGLRLTHLHYSYDNKVWQFLLPLSLGAEYRVAPHLSLYSLLEADLLSTRTAARRRNTQQSTVPTAALSIGLRYYYGQPHLPSVRPASPEFGKYLALDGLADWQKLTATSTLYTRQRGTAATLTPAVYALWGIQNRLRPHLVYDLNAGLGVLAPAHYYNFERINAHWDIGAQVNIRLYFAY